MRHIARKRFGQHFLVDRGVIRAILDAIRPAPDDLLVEIGPGLGALTRPLLESVGHLHVVELDRDLADRLRRAYPEERLTVHACDALKFDFGSLGPDLRVVGNLPYNISTPLLFHLGRFAPALHDLTFMLQKEVVQRMVAAPGGKDYGRLSVMLQYRFAMEALFSVPPSAFRPPPRVESAVVRMVPLHDARPRARSDARFAEIVSAAFSQRRKTIRNTLKPYLSAEDLRALGVDPGLRAEALAVVDFIRIADRVEAHRSGASNPSL